VTSFPTRIAVGLLTAGTMLLAGAPASATSHDATSHDATSHDAAAPTAPPAAAWLPVTPVAWPLVVDATTGRTETIARGITHTPMQWDTVAGRQSIQRLDVDLADTDVVTTVAEAGNVLTYPADETVSSMAARTGAVAGVNGDYFEIGASGRPIGGVMINGILRRSPVPGSTAQLGVFADGRIVEGPQTWTGSLRDGAQTLQLTSLNRPEDLTGTAITEITPYLGALPSIPRSTRVVGKAGPHGTFRVTAITRGTTRSPALKPGQVGLLGSRADAAWLGHHVRVGNVITLRGSLGSAGRGLRQLLSGASTLVHDGQVYDDPTGHPPFGTNPETLVSVSRDGWHVSVVTIDGRRGEATALGVTSAQAAGFAEATGAWDAIVFDGGGSTTMVGRHPGSHRLSVLDVPSGGGERPVANALLFSVRAGAVSATAPGRPVLDAAPQVAPAPEFTVPTGPGATNPTVATATGVKAASTATTVGAGAAGARPVAVGVWVHGPVTVDQPDASSLRIDGYRVPLYRTGSTSRGWQLFAADVPETASLPLTVTALDLRTVPGGSRATVVPTSAGIVGLYPPEAALATAAGTAAAWSAPALPPWLSLVTDPSAIRAGGRTLLVGGEADLASGATDGAGAAVLAAVGTRLATLPAAARPQSAQILGDLAASGSTADLATARQALTDLGLPGRDLVGPQEVTQPPGADPLGFFHTFGYTHYAYSLNGAPAHGAAGGGARVIATDSSRGGLLASDPTQYPGAEQYTWLVGQLDAAAAAGQRTVILATNLPAYSPIGDAAGQFTDRWEAQMYVRLAQRYRATHPGARVLLLSAQAHRFAVQVLDPQGRPASASVGIPQLTLGDLGVRPAVAAIAGGAPHIGLLHVDAQGVQLDVEPVLSAVTPLLPAGVSTALVSGQVVTLSAHALTVGGVGAPAQTIAIGGPFAHLWTSSAPGVVAVDPVTGIATAEQPGSAAITVTSGGVSGVLDLTVTAPVPVPVPAPTG
jgi:hypothetical protein